MDIYRIFTPEELLGNNTYPGRGIIIGKTPDGSRAVAAYFIMGRSGNSRNRIFTEKNGEVFTEPYDAGKVQDPSLIIYAAVRSFENNLIVTNGNQTDTIYDGLKAGKTFSAALESREFEPDAPNFTPRISGMLTFGGKDFTYRMSILKSADSRGSACNRYTFSYEALPGLGHFIHTYVCDGSPIPTFQGEPERMAIGNDIDDFTDELWLSLDKDNKISLYVRYTDLADGTCEERLINKNQCIIDDFLDENNEIDCQITCILSLIKSDKLELCIQKLTELGVSRIVLYNARRSIMKIKEDKKLLRLSLIAKEASQQCHRNRVPEIIRPCRIDQLKDYLSQYNYICYEGETNISDIPSCESITYMIGPEGGFEKEEYEQIKNLGFKSLSLGKRILRAETAAIYMTSIIVGKQQ